MAIYKKGFLAAMADKALQEKHESFRIHSNRAERLRTWQSEEEWTEGLREVRAELASRWNRK